MISITAIKVMENNLSQDTILVLVMLQWLIRDIMKQPEADAHQFHLTTSKKAWWTGIFHQILIQETRLETFTRTWKRWREGNRMWKEMNRQGLGQLKGKIDTKQWKKGFREEIS